MRIPIQEQLVEICRGIVATGKEEADWAEVESDDLFQREPFHGGYDATEGAFCFSYYDDVGGEWWFQLTLDEARRVASGEALDIDGHQAE